MFEAGNYIGPITSATTSQTRSGTPQMVIKIMVTATEDGQALAMPVERDVYMFLTDAAWENSRKKLETLGFNGDFNDPKFSAEAYDGGFAWQCKHDEYEGKTREKWELAKWGGPEVAPADKLRVLAAKWKSGSSARPPARPAPPRPPARPAAAATPAAAPAPTPAAFDDVKASTKDEAWQVYCQASDNKPSTPEWQGMIRDIGKPEASFTAADWQRVAEMAACPI